jgi:hypothetical protein
MKNDTNFAPSLRTKIGNHWIVCALIAWLLTVLIINLSIRAWPFLELNSFQDSVLFLGLKAVVFLGIYDVLDLISGCPFRCRYCGHVNKTRILTDCPACHKNVTLRVLRTPLRRWIVVLVLLSQSVIPQLASSGFFYTTQRWYFYWGSGVLFLHHGWHTPGYGTRTGPPDLSHCLVYLPIAPELLAALALVLAWREVTVYLARLRRKLDPRFCRCGYDLTGNISGVCPECGKIIGSRSTGAN